MLVDRVLDAQADAFARLLALSPGDPDDAFRRAAALAQGLFPHQIEGVAFLLGRRRAILADDMGLGKTRQAIVAMRHAAPRGPYLVVCPASVKHNWAREISIALPTASIHMVGRGAGAIEDHEWVDHQLRHPFKTHRRCWDDSPGQDSSSTRRTTSRITGANGAGSHDSSRTMRRAASIRNLPCISSPVRR